MLHESNTDTEPTAVLSVMRKSAIYNPDLLRRLLLCEITDPYTVSMQQNIDRIFTRFQTDPLALSLGVCQTLAFFEAENDQHAARGLVDLLVANGVADDLVRCCIDAGKGAVFPYAHVHLAVMMANISRPSRHKSDPFPESAEIAVLHAALKWAKLSLTEDDSCLHLPKEVVSFFSDTLAILPEGPGSLDWLAVATMKTVNQFADPHINLSSIELEFMLDAILQTNSVSTRALSAVANLCSINSGANAVMFVMLAIYKIDNISMFNESLDELVAFGTTALQFLHRVDVYVMSGILPHEYTRCWGSVILTKQIIDTVIVRFGCAHPRLSEIVRSWKRLRWESISPIVEAIVHSNHYTTALTWPIDQTATKALKGFCDNKGASGTIGIS